MTSIPTTEQVAALLADDAYGYLDLLWQAIALPLAPGAEKVLADVGAPIGRAYFAEATWLLFPVVAREIAETPYAGESPPVTDGLHREYNGQALTQAALVNYTNERMRRAILAGLYTALPRDFEAVTRKQLSQQYHAIYGVNPPREVISKPADPPLVHLRAGFFAMLHRLSVVQEQYYGALPDAFRTIVWSFMKHLTFRGTFGEYLTEVYFTRT